MSERSTEGTEPGFRLPADDVEGHMPRVSFVDPEKTDEDTEGHGNRLPGDDVDGHMPRILVDPEETDDDGTAGHGGRLPGARIPDDDVEAHGTRSVTSTEGNYAN